MKRKINLKVMAMILLSALFTSVLAQKNANYGDSLAGFDEENTKKAALQNGCFGAEFPVYMEMAKRRFINEKYNIKPPVNKFFLPNFGQKVTAVAPACQNEDFEDPSGVGNITTANQVNGWTVGYGNVSGANAVCFLTPSTCCNNAPQETQVFSVPGGLIDPVIGATYPIYSVFGSGAPNPGIGSNPQLGLPAMYGNNFIRINSSVGNPSHNSVAKLSKTFNVTPQNALFQFAFIGVFFPAHTCCDAPSMQIVITNATTNSVLPCPNYSVTVPTTACQNTNNIQFFNAGSGTPFTGSGQYVFNKWRLNTLDLTAYLNQNITIDVLVADCPYGGHYGYVYFDAQCKPMDIIGNGSNFPAGTPSITLPTCGANGATITLPSGLGPYSWSGPGITGNLTVPSLTNQTIVYPNNGTIQAIMNPAGACQPIIRNITVTITPAPNLILVPQQPSCSSTVTAINGTLTVGATPMSAIVTGPTGTVVTSVNANQLTTSPSTLAPGPYNVTIVDAIGCNISQQVTINPPLAIPSFSVGSPANDYTLTCLNSPITLTANTANPPQLNYIWSSPSGTATGNSINVTLPGLWTVTGIHPVSGCSAQVTQTIAQNVASPTIAFTPTVMNITCNVAASTFTGTSTGHPNVTTNWFQVFGTNTVYVGVPQGSLNLFQPSAPGVYWFVGTNNITGCSSTRSVNVTSSTGVPTFTVTSPTNFTIGCASTSVTSIQVSSVVTNPSNQPVQYAFVPPPATATPVFTNNPNLNNISVPGTYVVYVRDITNNCQVSQSVSIIQNIIPPNIDFIQPLSILSCRNPSMVLQGISSNNNTTITWTVPANPSPSVNPTANTTVVINPAVSGSTANVTTVGVFTVGATDNNNQCRAVKTVTINQDIRLPIFTISALTNSIITCKNPDVLIVPVVSTLIASQLVPTYTWFPPVGNPVPGTQFNSTAAGSHSAISMSSVNGCTTTASYNIGLDLNPPAVDFSQTFTLDCATNPTVQIFPTINGPTTGLTYNWYIFPAGVVVSNPSVAAIVATKIGEYGVVITNTANGCKADGTFDVTEGALSVDFTPSTTFGYAPLAVTFANNSASTFSTGTMVSNWSFGNGAVLTNTYVNNTSSVTPAATYTAPGTYSVYLTTTKGTCTGSKVRVIIVEVPSKIEVPNIFTPNGDKVNDIFRLIASGLGKIEATIFDRWGNKVYDVISETGNIAWDGKNLSGKECPAGTYFYMIKATGKDGEEYDLKGNVTLIR